MSDITTLQNASDILSASLSAEESIVDAALAAHINQSKDCGQTSMIFSTKLSDQQIENLKSKGYTVKVNGVNPEVTPQYIISWQPDEKDESEEA